ncbi:MAG: HDIG domain-containing protein [Anaerolineae bacterium]
MRERGSRLLGGRLLGELSPALLRRLGSGLVAAAFVIVSAGVLALNDPGTNSVEALTVGSVASSDIRAPFSLTYVSTVLTERQQQAAINQISPIYDPPDPNVARQQVTLLSQILDFIENVRADPYGTPDQKISDITKITALNLSSDVTQSVVTMDADTWNAVRAEMALVLERMMRESIRETDLQQVIDQLPTQVSVRLDPIAAGIVTAFVRDLLRPNRFPDEAATTAAREAASAAVAPESRSFERGQIIIRSGTRIDAVDYEALTQFNLLGSPDRRWEGFLRALLACVIAYTAFGLYAQRSKNPQIQQPSALALIGGLFLITLLGARLFNGDAQQIYLFPAAALSLLIVGIVGWDVAVLLSIGLAFLIGMVAEDSLEVAAMVGSGAIMGALSLRRSERLNSYFFAGVVVALANLSVILMFGLGVSRTEGSPLPLLLLYGISNGLLSGMVALAALYMITLLFNLPTSLKLVELSQPSQPLLQRLLREAPGTYQHSLQVANLGEQAANAVGADASLVRVAALYHDIGKMLNPAFFVENQADNINPHDMLNDPYRSADIIISHVTDGDKLARGYRLPQRIRDFICEHHGTTMVSYFYNQALKQASVDEPVDVEQFTYPGPRPRTRETAILMLADSCESSVRAAKPANKAEIEAIVGRIFDSRMREKQLDDSGLTLNDLTTIREILIDMLQAVFHPRIQYPTMPYANIPVGASGTANTLADTRPHRTGLQALPEPGLDTNAGFDEHALAAEAVPNKDTAKEPAPREVSKEPLKEPGKDTARDATSPTVPKMEIRYTSTQELPAAIFDDEDTPLPDVPPLRRRSDDSRPDDTGEAKAASEKDHDV